MGTYQPSKLRHPHVIVCSNSTPKPTSLGSLTSGAYLLSLARHLTLTTGKKKEQKRMVSREAGAGQSPSWFTPRGQGTRTIPLHVHRLPWGSQDGYRPWQLLPEPNQGLPGTASVYQKKLLSSWPTSGDRIVSWGPSAGVPGPADVPQCRGKLRPPEGRSGQLGTVSKPDSRLLLRIPLHQKGLGRCSFSKRGNRGIIINTGHTHTFCKSVSQH